MYCRISVVYVDRQQGQKLFANVRFSESKYRELKHTKTETATGTSPKNGLKWAKQWLCTCVIKLCRYLCRPLQNSEMTKFCIYCRNLGQDGKYFEFPYGNDRWHYIFSLSRFLDTSAFWTGLVTYEIRESNLIPFFAGRRPWRRPRQCVSSLIRERRGKVGRRVWRIRRISSSPTSLFRTHSPTSYVFKISFLYHRS